MIKATTDVKTEAPSIIIHSDAGWGKTSFLCEAVQLAKNGILFQCGENALSDLSRNSSGIDYKNIPHYPEVLGKGANKTQLIEGYQKFKSVLKELIVEDHGYDLVAFDNLDYIINRNIDMFVIKEYYQDRIDKANGWGGAKYAEMGLEIDKILLSFQMLQEKGITVVVSMHSSRSMAKDFLSADDYKKYTFNIPSSDKHDLRGKFLDWVSLCGFGRFAVEMDGKRAIDSTPVLCIGSHPAYDTKCRYSCFPFEMEREKACAEIFKLLE